MTNDWEETRDVEEQHAEEEEKLTLDEQLSLAQQEIVQLQDRYLRSRAELENYKKRILREREQQQLRTRMEIVRGVLPVVDDFCLALSHVPQEEASTGWVEGLVLIKDKLDKYLASQGVTTIDAVGQPFDPHFHDGVAVETSSEHPEGTIIEEIRTGYMMDNEVLRPSMVKVAKKPDQASE
ncbi:MAG: nucleotide exchange factor GrpE [Anaerolineae bacterium]|jgi:molecular chaperone GrpE